MVGRNANVKFQSINLTDIQKCANIAYMKPRPGYGKRFHPYRKSTG